jgi:DNA-binding response OmpR family regulator
METVLIIEADDRTLKARGDELLLDGLNVRVARTRRQAEVALGDHRIDAVALGTLEGHGESLVFLRGLRGGEMGAADAHVPVVAVGADSDHSALRFYQAGADVALPSGASPLLIKGALDALARRAETQRHPRFLRVGRLTVNSSARVATVEGIPLTLTRLEFDLLEALARDPHRAFTKGELLRDVWGYDPGVAGVGRTVDGHASRLRRKLRDAGPDDLVQSIRGVGYRLSH